MITKNRMQNLCLMVCFYFLSIASAQSAELAFFKSVRPNGQIERFEGLYSHVAIRFQNQWLHAHPRYGIELITTLDHLGEPHIILVHSSYPEPDPEFVEAQLKKQFNIFASWSDPIQTYCSKLAGQYLNIRPTKMHFNSKDWDFAKAKLPKGQLGLSPNDVYWFARRHLNFKKKKNAASTHKKSCQSYLF